MTDRKIKTVPDTRTLKYRIRQETPPGQQHCQSELAGEADSYFDFDYHRLLVQIKNQGIKGKVKSAVFHLSRFLTLWQEKFNIHIQHRTGELNGNLTQLEQRQNETEKRLERIESPIEEKLKTHRRLIFEHQQQSRQRVFETAVGKDETHPEDSLPEAMYIAFEEHFRGSRSDIQKRLSIYRPVISAQFSPSEVYALDIGCGRGEWLQYLMENGIRAKGVDLNRTAVEECRENGLDAETAEALAFMKSVPAFTFHAVTGFHIIEHLAFEKIFALMDEIYRVLAPGGIMIFETPNPTNILVSACDFYRDPGHLRPVHPDTALFAAEYRGFENPRIHLVQQEDSHYRLTDFDAWKFDTIDNYIEIPRDYALIARKPPATTETG